MQIELFLKNDLAVHFYYKQENTAAGKIILENLYLIFPGLPQFSGKDFFKDKINKKSAFMYIHYYGSYFSGGNFSFANCQKTVVDAICFAKNGKGIKTYNNKQMEWSAKNIIIVANSFGASPVLTSNIGKKKINEIVLISPLIFIYKHDIKQFMSKEEIKKFNNFNKNHFDFLCRGYKNNYRGIGKNVWKKYFSGNLLSSKINLKKKFPPIIIFHGQDDRIVKPKGSIFFKNQYSNSITLNLIEGMGHDFEALFNVFLLKNT